MAEYRITRVSQDVPREWGQGDKKTYYIKVMLDGHSKPVSIGKNSPTALKVGDTVTGRIVETQYAEDKWEHERKAFTGGGFKADPDKQAQIKAQWAIGKAKDWVLHTTQEVADIEPQAKQFFAMVDRVKNGTTTGTTAPELQTTATTKKPDVVVTDIPDDPINLDDIPF
jgi:hypothetical protein